MYSRSVTVTKPSTKLNQQNENYCVSREKLWISEYIESNPGPVAWRARYTYRNPSMALLQVRLVQEGLKDLEYTSHGPCSFSSVVHSQLYNDPSYDINVRAAGVEHIRKNRQKYIGPITELLWMCCHSNVQGVMHLLCKQFQMHYE